MNSPTCNAGTESIAKKSGVIEISLPPKATSKKLAEKRCPGWARAAQNQRQPAPGWAHSRSKEKSHLQRAPSKRCWDVDVDVVVVLVVDDDDAACGGDGGDDGDGDGDGDDDDADDDDADDDDDVDDDDDADAGGGGGGGGDGDDDDDDDNNDDGDDGDFDDGDDEDEDAHTQNLLHTHILKASTHRRLLLTETFTHRRFYTANLLQKNFWHSNHRCSSGAQKTPQTQFVLNG